jgi:hypothetical protein
MLNSLLYTKLVTNRQQSDQGCFSKEKIKKSTTLETLKKNIEYCTKNINNRKHVGFIKESSWATNCIH